MPVIETLVARLEADTAQFQASLTAARRTLGGLETGMANVAKTSDSSHRAINTLKGGMVSLALQATGTAGPVGKLAQGLLLFGGGSTLILGVAAGIGAIALAYEALSRSTKQAIKDQDDMVKSLQGLGVHAQLSAAQIVLAGQRAQLAEVQKGRKGLFPWSRGDVDEAAQGNLQSQIATQLLEVARLEGEVAKWQQGIANDAYNTWRSEQAHVAALKDGLGVLLRMKALGESPGFDKAQDPQGVFKTLSGKDIAFKGAESDILDSVRRLGESAGKQLVLGMLTGIQSMEDVFKSILLQFLSFGLESLFGNIFAPITKTLGIGGGTGKAGIEQSMKSISPASFNVSMSGLQMQPLTAYAVSRDPGFQQLLREGWLVARSDGFKG